jgi:hypothetical protein
MKFAPKSQSTTKHRMFRATNLRQSREFTPTLLVMLETFRRSEGTKHIRSRKCHFLRRHLLLELTPILMFTICTEHIRIRKCHFLRRLLLLQLNPVILVTTGTERSRSRKYQLFEAITFTTAYSNCYGYYMY